MNVSPRLLGVLSVVIALAGIACGDDSTTTPSATTTSPTTVTWTTLLSAGGSASRSFVASQSGTVSIALQAAPVPIGIGVGVPASSVSGCRPSSSVTASPGDPQLTAAVQPGSYCVFAFDVGGISSVGNQISFTIQLVYP